MNFDSVEMMVGMCRAKREDNNEWTLGYYVFDEYPLVVENLRTIVRGTAELINVHPIQYETIGRWTGWYDKNGTPIFEGDIIKHFGIKPYVVKYGAFAENVGLGYYYGIGFYLQWAGDQNHKVPMSHISCEKGEYEILGNVHDNLELLKSED